MQAWRFEPGRRNYITVDGPRDPNTNALLPAPVPNPPALAPDPSLSQPRASRGTYIPQLNQTGSPTHNMVVNRSGGNSHVSQNYGFIEPLPAASIPTHISFNNVDAVLAPRISPYATNLDLYHQRRGYFSPLAGDTREFPDSSRTLCNSPELSSSSRNSSMSAIPDAYLPARNSSYSDFNFAPGSPYPTHNSSVSSISNPYTPASSRNQSGSSHTFPNTASDEACKLIIRYVKAGTTHEDLSILLDEKMRWEYRQHERPKQGEDNKWSVMVSKEETAERARERLHNAEFKGEKLKVHLNSGSSRRHINSGGSTAGAKYTSVSHKPTIVDGSITS